MSSRSSARALIGDTELKLTINTIKSNFGFWGEGKLEFPEKTSRCRVENQETQPTLNFNTGPGNWTRATLVRGQCFHHCTNPAPLKCDDQCFGNLCKSHLEDDFCTGYQNIGHHNKVNLNHLNLKVTQMSITTSPSQNTPLTCTIILWYYKKNPLLT